MLPFHNCTISKFLKLTCGKTMKMITFSKYYEPPNCELYQVICERLLFSDFQFRFWCCQYSITYSASFTIAQWSIEAWNVTGKPGNLTEDKITWSINWNKVKNMIRISNFYFKSFKNSRSYYAKQNAISRIWLENSYHITKYLSPRPST